PPSYLGGLVCSAQVGIVSRVMLSVRRLHGRLEHSRVFGRYIVENLRVVCEEDVPWEECSAGADAVHLRVAGCVGLNPLLKLLRALDEAAAHTNDRRVR